MKSEPNHALDQYRIDKPARSDPGANWGAFMTGGLRIISSGVDIENGCGLEHVSISRADRCPSWEDMDRVKRLFWDDEETVVQFHPKLSVRINVHPFCLHLWKRIGHDYELPTHILL